MRDRAAALLLLLPVTVALVVSGVRLLAEARDVPDDRDIAAAAAFAVTAAGPEDAIVVLPPWSMRPLSALGPAAARVVGGDGPAAELLSGRHAIVVAIVEPDADPWLPVLAPLGPPVTIRHFGRIAVQVHGGGGPAAFDLLSRLPDGAVDVDGRPCTTPLRRGAVIGFACDHAGTTARVTREHALVTENGRRVVRVPALAPESHLALRFTDVPLGDVLVVAAGHTRAGAERGRPMVVEVIVDDDVVAVLRRAPSFVVEPSRAALRSLFVRAPAPGGEGFRADLIDTRRFAGGRHRLAFVVRATTADAAGKVDHEFALDAFIPAARRNP